MLARCCLDSLAFVKCLEDLNSEALQGPAYLVHNFPQQNTSASGIFFRITSCSLCGNVLGVHLELNTCDAAHAGQLFDRQSVCHVRGRGGEVLLLGLEDMQDLPDTEGARWRLHRLRVASTRVVKGRNMRLGWAHQVLGLMLFFGVLLPSFVKIEWLLVCLPIELDRHFCRVCSGELQSIALD
jgi:hypothetical protein